MSLVPSLLQAIVQLDGEALVMHVGDKPYVVSPTGQVDLATRGLSLEAVVGVVNQLLPVESQLALEEFGAAQYELPPMPEFPGEQFTIVAARGGDDLWTEIRRHRITADDEVPAELFAESLVSVVAQSDGVVASGVVHDHDLSIPDADQLFQTPGPPPAVHEQNVVQEHVDEDLTLQTEEPPAALEVPAPIAAPPPAHVTHAPLADIRSVAPAAYSLRSPALEATESHSPELRQPEARVPEPRVSEPPIPASRVPEPRVPEARVPEPRVPELRMSEPHVPEPRMPETRTTEPPTENVRGATPEPPRPEPYAYEPAAQAASGPERWVAPSAPPEPRWVPPPAPAAEARVIQPTPAPQERWAAPPVYANPGVVLPLSRNPIRGDVPPPLAEQALAGLDRLLRLAAARGASTLYLSSASRPSVRVDGDVVPLDGAPVLGPNDVESLLLTLMPERSAEALRTGVASEWICELPDVGRVRCMSFRDHRGPGGVFRMMPGRAITAEQLGLSREIQALAIEPEGLLLVSGPRSSGKRTLISALIDLINRTRRDHVISIESEINVVHERNGSFISQREVRGGIEEMVAVARAALREDPDILVLEELRSAALMDLALDAAGSGQLVIGGFPAHNASSAIDRIIDLYPPEHRRQVQLSLAQNLRGVVAQVLLRKTSGGRVAAREVLLNTPAVAGVLAEGKTSQLPLAIEGGRRQGMVPLNDALVGFVQSGVVDVREAYRRAADRSGFLALLKRQGIDTSAIERYG